jgi:hypothetical protein
MASRPLIVAGLLGASVGVPYLASQSQQVAATSGKPPAAVSGFGASSQKPFSWTNPFSAATASAPPSPAPVTTGVPMTRSAPQLDGAQFSSVQQVFRFDVTKAWVLQNWTRKSTGPTDVGLFSIRVPLVMGGTQVSALAGSLTYFFNVQGQVEHISFRGRTGDASPLIQLLTHHYQFKRVESPIGEHVYQVQSGEGVQSELRTRPESVLRSSAPQQSVAVELEFARPGSPRLLPPRGPSLVIPQGAASPATTAATASSAASASDSMSSSIKAAASNYWDQVRYATPSEESQVLWKRWPE